MENEPGQHRHLRTIAISGIESIDPATVNLDVPLDQLGYAIACDASAESDGQDQIPEELVYSPQPKPLS